VRKMKRIAFVILFAGLVGGVCGCGAYYAGGYEYRYQAGTMYEYNKLMDAYDPDSGNPPPLPPASEEPTEGRWVRVPVRTEPVYVRDYYPAERIVVVDPFYDPFCDGWFYPRRYISTSFFYGPRRHYHGSSVSVGFGFGHGGYFHNPFWHRGHFGHYGYRGYCLP